MFQMQNAMYRRIYNHIYKPEQLTGVTHTLLVKHAFIGMGFAMYNAEYLVNFFRLYPTFLVILYIIISFKFSFHSFQILCCDCQAIWLTMSVLLQLVRFHNVFEISAVFCIFRDPIFDPIFIESSFSKMTNIVQLQLMKITILTLYVTVTFYIGFFYILSYCMG